MVPTLFVAALVQETNVFSPLPTGLQSFRGRFSAGGVCGDEDPPFPPSVLDAARRRARAGQVRLLTGPWAGAQPGGRVTRGAYEALRNALLDSLSAALPVDLVALELHGAMTADGYDDCEGDLMCRVRERLPAGTLIGAIIDPHAHLSAEMVRAADLIVAWKEYPHTDFRERADELLDLLLASHRGAIRPVSAVWDAGVIGVYHTNRPAVRALVQRMRSWEIEGRALSASLVHGFPWGDCRDLGTRALVVTDSDAAAANALAQELAEAAREVALSSEKEELPLEDAIEVALRDARQGGTVVLADGPDNPGGGSAGDSTFVLAALLAKGVESACLGPLWDPGAVSLAFEAGPGARLPLRLGGKTGPRSGQPIDAMVEVTSLCENGSQTFAGATIAMGRTAALRVGGIEVVATERRTQAYGLDLFSCVGIPVADRRIVIVKSSQHFRAAFAPIAARIIYLECDGSLQTNLSTFPYARVQRPRWPIDPEAPAPWAVLDPLTISDTQEHA